MPNVGKKDPYKVLDISSSATDDEIKAAYKRMVNTFAPFHDSSVLILDISGQALAPRSP
jgi:preprotein translocase subunit Sec63